MNASIYRISVILTACALLATTACKKKNDDASEDTFDSTLEDSGVVFRDGFMEQTIPGMTRGVQSASKLNEECAGFIGEEPSSEVSFAEDVPMRIHVTADDDLVLAIEGPNEVFCNDDFDGHQPSIARTWESGKYAVYVGTKEKSESDVLYELNFDHYDPNRPLEPTPLADNDAEPNEEHVSYEPVLLESPSPVIRLASGTLPFDANAKPLYETYPFVPSGIAQQVIRIEEDTLPSRTTVVDEEACPAQVDPSAPDFVVNMVAAGDMHLSAATNHPVALVVSSRSDRVYCALPSKSNESTLRFENLPEGKYAVRIAPLMERDPEGEEDEEDVEDAASDNKAEDAADSAEADDAAADTPEDQSIEGLLHFY